MVSCTWLTRYKQRWAEARRKPFTHLASNMVDNHPS